MTVWLVAIPAALLIGVVCTEVLRPQPRAGIDTLRLAALIFCLAFVVAPVQLATTNLDWVRGTTWAWVANHLPTAGTFVGAELLAGLAWCTVLIGYFAIRRAPLRIHRLDALVTNQRSVATVMVALGVVGIAALLGYTHSIGGWRVLIFDALAFRSAEPPVITRWAFLKSVAPLTLGAAFLAFGLYHDARTAALRRLAAITLPIAVLVSLVVLFHQAGRLSMLAFIVAFPLAIAVWRGRLRLRLALGVLAVFGVMILFGKQLFNLQAGDTLLRSQWSSLQGEAGNALRMIGIEFSFPFVSLAHFIQTVPWHQPLRWFADVPLAFSYLIPQRFFGVVHSPTITAINTQALGTSGAIPVDLVSFGFVSAWIPGILLVSSAFGVVMGWLDQQALTTTFTASVLRVVLMLFLAFRVMYADPTLILQGGFYLLVLLLALRLVGGVARRVQQ